MEVAQSPAAIGTPGGSGTPGAVSPVNETVTDGQLERIGDAYRGTVMSVPHYEAEYEETVPESLAAELGPDTATSLAANGTLSPPAKRTLVRRSRKAAVSRESLADAIETERDALDETLEELTAIDRRRRRLVDHLSEIDGDASGAAIDVWERLEDLESELGEIATERQRTLREPPSQVDSTIDVSGEMAFYDYLYGPTDGPNHPVLSQIAALSATVREDRNRIAARIAEEG
jgi:hypothetical protein